MSTVTYYTHTKKIPAFVIIFHDDGTEPDVDFYNPRTKVHDTMTITDFIMSLFRIIAA